MLDEHAPLLPTQHILEYDEANPPYLQAATNVESIAKLPPNVKYIAEMPNFALVDVQKSEVLFYIFLTFNYRIC